MNNNLSSQHHAALRKIADDPNLIISMFDVQRLVSEDYITYSSYTGWMILDKGKQFLINNT